MTIFPVNDLFTIIVVLVDSRNKLKEAKPEFSHSEMNTFMLVKEIHFLPYQPQYMNFDRANHFSFFSEVSR